MEQLTNFGDKRTLAFCAFCGGKTGTRDHCPSRVLLDDPFPSNLPVVPACPACNNGFSADEEYVACLLACVIAGSTEPERVARAKVRRLLTAKPALRSRIESSRRAEGETTLFIPEHDRIVAVVKKLARGHAMFELHEILIDEPTDLWFLPLENMQEHHRTDFESPESSNVWPEVGSRAMQRLISGADVTCQGWVDVQPGRYRYSAQLSDGVDVRFVISEYLACQVRWGY